MLRPADFELLTELQITHTTYRDGGTTLLVLHDYPLPAGYSADTVEVLIVVPDQYPDAALDMWWVYPWITFSNGVRPANADQPQVFANYEPEPGRVWQRFSRHPAWRMGQDDLRTFLLAMRSTFENEAAAVARAA
jgi:hypothetical protein